MSISFGEAIGAVLIIASIATTATVIFLALFKPQKLKNNPSMPIKAMMVVSFLFGWLILYAGLSEMIWLTGKVREIITISISFGGTFSVAVLIEKVLNLTSKGSERHHPFTDPIPRCSDCNAPGIPPACKHCGGFIY